MVKARFLFNCYVIFGVQLKGLTRFCIFQHLRRVSGLNRFRLFSFLKVTQFTILTPEADLGLLQHPRWNYYHKVFYLGYCNSPRSASRCWPVFCIIMMIPLFLSAKFLTINPFSVNVSIMEKTGSWFYQQNVWKILVEEWHFK